MYLLLSFFALSLVILSVLAAPISAKVAQRIGGLDHPETRKAHRFPTPRMGGLGIGVLFFGSITGLILTGFLPLPIEAFAFLITLAFITLIGLLDDIKNTPALVKLLSEILLAVVVFASGLRFSSLSGDALFAISETLLTPVHALTDSAFPAITSALTFSLDLVCTVAWFVLLSNAINLVDGLDGLATSTGVTIAGMLALALAWAVPLAQSLSLISLLCLFILLLIGFLHWNLPPAVIFLGDSGSLFIGWFLAGMSLWGGSTLAGHTPYPTLLLAGILLLFGYPLSDTCLSITRRLTHCIAIKSNNYIKHILKPDRLHLHHRLNPDGRHVNQVLRRLMLLNLTFCVLALATVILSSDSTFALSINENWVALRYLPLMAGFVLLAILLVWQHSRFLSAHFPPQHNNFPPTT